MRRIVLALVIMLFAYAPFARASTIIVGTSFQTAASGNANNAVPVPAGVLNGDTLFMCFKLDSSKTVTTLGGTFTSCTNFASLVDVTASTYDMKCGCRTASSEPASYTPTWTGSAASIGEIAIVRNTDGTTPAIDVAPTTATDATNITSITTSTNNDLIVAMVLDAAGGAGLITAGAQPMALSLNVANAHVLYATQETAGATTWIPTGLAYSGAGTRLGITIAVKSNTTTAATFTGRSYDTYNSGAASSLVAGAPTNGNANDTLIVPITELTPAVAITAPPVIGIRGCAVPANVNGTSGSIVYNRSAFVDANGIAAPPQSGDMLIAESTSVGAVTTIPTSFNLQTNTAWGSGGVANLETWTKLAGGSEPSSYTFSLAGNNMYCGSLCAVYDSSGGTLTVGNTQASTSGASAVTSFGATSVTTGHNNAYIHNAWAWNIGSGSITLPATQNSAFSQATGGAIAQAVGWLNQHTAGAIPTQTATAPSGPVATSQIEIYSTAAAALGGSTVWAHQSPTAVKNESATVQEDLYSMVAPNAESIGPALFVFGSSESSSDGYMVDIGNLNTTTPIDSSNSLVNEGLAASVSASLPAPTATDELAAVFQSYATCTPAAAQATGTNYSQTMLGGGRASAYLMTADYEATWQLVDACANAFASIAVGLNANTTPTRTTAQMRIQQQMESIFSLAPAPLPPASVGSWFF
jgi:hypothetical protein